MNPDWQSELAALRAERDRDAAAIHSLRADLDKLAAEFRAEVTKAHATARQLLELERRVGEGRETAEGLRLKLVALAKQVEWEGEKTARLVEAMVTSRP